MKRFAPLFPMVAFALLAAFTLPGKPKARGIAASFAVAPDSTVNATLAVTITGQMLAGDSIRYRVYKDGVIAFTKMAATLSLSATGIPAPAYGVTAVYKGCAIMTRAAVNQGGEVCGAATWTYARPLSPPATLNGVTITPASATLQTGQSITVTVTS